MENAELLALGEVTAERAEVAIVSIHGTVWVGLQLIPRKASGLDAIRSALRPEEARRVAGALLEAAAIVQGSEARDDGGDE